MNGNSPASPEGLEWAYISLCGKIIILITENRKSLPNWMALAQAYDEMVMLG
jgi:hypothetical protein